MAKDDNIILLMTGLLRVIQSDPRLWYKQAKVHDLFGVTLQDELLDKEEKAADVSEMELLKKKAKSGADDKNTQKRNAEKFLQWLGSHLVPMLSQTAEAPCASAKFSMAELDHLDAQMKKLIAVTSGRAAAAQGSAAGGGADQYRQTSATNAPAASAGAESSFTSESADAPKGAKRGDGVSDERDERAGARSGAHGRAGARAEEMSKTCPLARHFVVRANFFQPGAWMTRRFRAFRRPRNET